MNAEDISILARLKDVDRRPVTFMQKDASQTSGYSSMALFFVRLVVTFRQMPTKQLEQMLERQLEQRMLQHLQLEMS
jgi:hypothetical protein